MLVVCKGKWKQLFFLKHIVLQHNVYCGIFLFVTNSVCMSFNTAYGPGGREGPGGLQLSFPPLRSRTLACRPDHRCRRHTFSDCVGLLCHRYITSDLAGPTILRSC